MSSIQAFVGHSFNDVDAPVVRTFLDFLDGVGGAIPGFSWKHAERPEPKIVTEKVLELLEDRNVFIGICTRKERVISEAALQHAVLGRYLVADKDLEWKASDWVIQEIGLAIGRGLKIILLLEEGVRLPGALQGNLEYIPFSRAAPDRALSKLLHMLTSLSPRSVAAEAGPARSEAATEAVSDVPEKVSEADSADMAPKVTSSQRQFEFAVLRATILEDAAELASVDAIYRSSPLFDVADNAACWEAYQEYAKLRFGKKGSLPKLEEIAAKNPASSRVFKYLGTIYEEYEDFTRAATLFEKAADTSPDIPTKLGLLRKAMSAKAANSDLESAVNVLGRIKELWIQSGQGEAEVLRAINDLSTKGLNEDELIVASWERLLELDPTDHATRFSLAYKYSSMSRNELALLHYARIPAAERDGMAWNNYGVAREELGMPAKSVEAYREAERLGETLAMSNIANRQIRSGFLQEASAICQAALQISDHHKNVDESLRRIKEVPDEEVKREEQVLERARLISSFYRDIGVAMTGQILPFPSEWQAQECTLTLAIEGDRFKLVGKYKKRVSSLLSMLGESNSKELEHTVEYSGTVCGLALFGTVARKSEGDSPSTLLAGLGVELPRVLMWYSPDSRQLKVMELSQSSEPKQAAFLAVQ